VSSIDRLRSFAESRSCPDHAIIQAGLTYGDARMLFTGIECMKAELAEAEQQRDAARLELRALEWLLALQPSRHDLEAALWLAPRAAEAIANAGMSHDYASAATALGWEGT